MIHTHLSSGAGTIGQLVAGVPRGVSLAPPDGIKKKIHLFMANLGEQIKKEVYSALFKGKTIDKVFIFWRYGVLLS
jgi:hypothetical protein